MRKFVSQQKILNDIKCYTDDNAVIKELLDTIPGVSGSLKHELCPELPLSFAHPDITDMAEMEIGKLLPPVRERCFHADDIHLIESALHSYYQEYIISD